MPAVVGRSAHGLRRFAKSVRRLGDQTFRNREGVRPIEHAKGDDSMKEWIGLAMLLGALACVFLAVFRNRNALGWFVLGALFPGLGLLILCAIEPLGPDGMPARRCCVHCPHLNTTERA
jgi:hypothetical protein